MKISFVFLPASPQSGMKPSTENIVMNSLELNSKCASPQRSPSVISICSDGGIECTPPHKKMAINMDETLDFSPKMFDSSFSPNCLLSQTLAIDSPEVGWKWSRHPAKSSDLSRKAESTSVRTPDSAYAADSSFASAGSSSTEVGSNGHIRGNCSKQRNAFGARRDQRKIMEQELRRVEHTRAEEMLKQRCAKLQEQLKSAGTQNVKPNTLPKEGILKKYVDTTCESSNRLQMKSANTAVKFQTPEKLEKPDNLSDFFNDSEMDGFLLEATQDIESKIVAKTQPAFVNCASTTQQSSIYTECSSTPHARSAPAATTTPPCNKSLLPPASMSSASSENSDKRSSLYMKFLEDDFPDEWFVSLDEVILQAIENKKPRNSLQRYKSMPTETAGTSKDLLNKKDNNDNCILNTNLIEKETTPSSSTLSKMKRHSSTHMLSPAGSHCKS